MKKNRKKRQAIHRDGERRILLRQRSQKGYDVEMIRDFFDHLLLELRTLQFEHVNMLKQMEASQGWSVEPTISGSLVAQNSKFIRKYESALVPMTVFDVEDTTDYEKKLVATAILKNVVEHRDEQIGILEKLQPLIEEALQCAKMPLGVNCGPARQVRVRDVIDECEVEASPLSISESAGDRYSPKSSGNSPPYASINLNSLIRQLSASPSPQLPPWY